MKQRNKRIVGAIIALLILLIFIYIIYSNFGNFKQLSFISPQNIVLIVFLQVIFLMNNGLMLKWFLTPFNINLKIKEWFGLSCITSFANYFIPSIGGATSRAVYLKKKYQFSYSSFIGNLYGNYIMIFFVNSLVAIISFLLLKKLYGYWNVPILLIYAGIFLTSLFFIIFHINPQKIKFSEKIRKVVEGWENVRKNKPLLLKIILIGLINIITSSLIFFFEFRIFGVDINFLTSIIIAVTSMLAIFVNITPGALGIKESLITLISVTLAIPLSTSIAVSLIDRVIGLIVIFTLGPIFSYILLKHQPKNETNI